ncbi:hypothetical protein BT96DRAFT_970813 [Gymnopus androsaceus JB14]|uniref:F-box domain-containing protein n=1 Tax=Gymnopus androsaceus JB14 TaxID=1447944 RepID=A0A6A4IBU1_9AGAR|nr:hypothetical protein BT96DRAFT_970813 [Gymnopus androsaceus JB14]
MMEELSVLPELPTEIEEYIIQWVVRLWIQWSPREISNLTIVSKRVQSIVEPVVYETVVHRFKGGSLGGYPEGYISPFQLALDARPAAFFACHVKNLYIAHHTNPEFALRMLKVCSGVENLHAMGFRLFQNEIPSAVSLIGKLSLRSLSVHISVFESIPAHESTFPNLKYLALFINEDYGDDLPSLTWLRALTHVRFEPTRDREKQVKGDIKKVLLTLKDIEVLVICVEDWVVNFDRTRGLRRKWMKLDQRVKVEDFPTSWRGFIRGGEFYVNSDDEDSDSD